jgi:uncharacterized protein YwgA
LSFAETNRYKDVLFALQAANEVNVNLGRLQLQKLVYLADILAVAWRAIAKPTAFLPYKNGPYDPTIQNVVDALAFRGLVEVTEVAFRQPRITGSSYRLSKAGGHAIETVTVQPTMRDDLDLYREIAKEMDRRGWNNIKRLVYAEPTYEATSAGGTYRRLQTDTRATNLSWRILNDFQDAFSIEESLPMSRTNLVQLFFAILDEHAGLSGEHAE